MRLGDSASWTGIKAWLQNPKGPLIGPMVICGVVIDSSRLNELKCLGVRDSKLLTPKQRESISERILEIAEDYSLIVVDPEEIDATLESVSSNLNWLEAEKAAEIINSLKSDRVVMDCPSTNIDAFCMRMKSMLTKNVELLCEHKADKNHLEVAAASIIAKVVRDREIEKIKNRINIDFGSGYPSDPKTRDFLLRHWKDYSNIFRKTWSSYRRVAGIYGKIKQESQRGAKGSAEGGAKNFSCNEGYQKGLSDF